MALWRDDPERAADALSVASLPDLDLPPADQSKLLLIDAGDGLKRALFEHGGRTGCTVVRRADASNPAPLMSPPRETWGTFNTAFVRLPKSKDELEFALHRLMRWVAPKSRIYIYGGNDEGIRSAPKRLASLGVPIETVAAHSHGRVLMLQSPADLAHIRVCDEQWRMSGTIDLGQGSVPWASYPGVFAGGRLDDATALLLQHVPTLNPGTRVLDYGCGTGVIARALLDRDPSLKVTALDADHFALLATQENVPAAKTLLGFRLKGTGRHDLIVSNPPIHSGFREDYAALHDMIENAPLHLLPRGRLLLVVQRRVPVEAQLKAKFQSVETLADEGPFRVWSAMLAAKRDDHAIADDVEIIADDGEDW